MKKWFFFEYCEEDSEKLFFYDFTPFGNYIFKKDGYSIPKSPDPEYIDFIRVAYESGEKYYDINEIVSFFNNVNDDSLSYSNSFDFQNEIYMGVF